MNARQTREQQRAANAWQNIEQVEKQAENIRKEYSSLARGLPAMIQTNGLGQSLAFLRAKGGNDQHKPHSILYLHLSHWLMQGSEQDVLEWIIQQNTDAYRLATTEALSYTIWLRRFAEAKGWGEITLD